MEGSRSSRLLFVALLIAVWLSPANARAPLAPPLIQQLNNGDWLPQQEAEQLRFEV